MKKLLKLSISRDIFEAILSKNVSFLEKEASSYWKKELLEPKFEDNKILYDIYKIEKIILTNGLGNDKPQITIEIDNENWNGMQISLKNISRL